MIVEVHGDWRTFTRSTARRSRIARAARRRARGGRPSPRRRDARALGVHLGPDRGGAWPAGRRVFPTYSDLSAFTAEPVRRCRSGRPRSSSACSSIQERRRPRGRVASRRGADARGAAGDRRQRLAAGRGRRTRRGPPDRSSIIEQARPEEVSRRLDEATILVLPSWPEGLGRVIDRGIRARTRRRRDGCRRRARPRHATASRGCSCPAPTMDALVAALLACSGTASLRSVSARRRACGMRLGLTPRSSRSRCGSSPTRRSPGRERETRLRHADARRRSPRARPDARPRRGARGAFDEVVVLCATSAATTCRRTSVCACSARPTRLARGARFARARGRDARGRAPDAVLVHMVPLFLALAAPLVKPRRVLCCSGTRTGGERRFASRRRLADASSPSTAARSRSGRRRFAGSATRSTSSSSAAAPRQSRGPAAAARSRAVSPAGRATTRCSTASARGRARSRRAARDPGPQLTDAERAHRRSSRRVRGVLGVRDASGSRSRSRATRPGAARRADGFAQRDAAARHRRRSTRSSTRRPPAACRCFEQRALDEFLGGLPFSSSFLPRDAGVLACLPRRSRRRRPATALEIGATLRERVVEAIRSSPGPTGSWRVTTPRPSRRMMPCRGRSTPPGVGPTSPAPRSGMSGVAVVVLSRGGLAVRRGGPSRRGARGARRGRARARPLCRPRPAQRPLRRRGSSGACSGARARRSGCRSCARSLCSSSSRPGSTRRGSAARAGRVLVARARRRDHARVRARHRLRLHHDRSDPDRVFTSRWRSACSARRMSRSRRAARCCTSARVLLVGGPEQLAMPAARARRRIADASRYDVAGLSRRDATLARETRLERVAAGRGRSSPRGFRGGRRCSSWSRRRTARVCGCGWRRRRRSCSAARRVRAR